MSKIAIIGTGLIGRSWAIVFARAGLSVSLWDAHAPAVTAALEFIARRLPELSGAGLLQGRSEDAIMNLLTPVDLLEEAVFGAQYVQESGPERFADKQALFADMDRMASAGTVLASSTSAIRASELPKDWPGARAASSLIRSIPPTSYL